MLARLKNGSELQPKPLTVIMFSLKQTLNNHPVAFYELVMLCRNHDHKIPGGQTGEKMETIEEYLKRMSLIGTNGLPHGTIQDVVLSAVTGEGVNLELGSPYWQG